MLNWKKSFISVSIMNYPLFWILYVNFRCTKCGFEATHVLELARHKTFAHRLNCSHCAFTTNQDHLLEKHILTHKDVKRFKCDICPYASKRKADLQAHRKRHFEDKSEYQCERCGFVTHLKSALARHKARIHKEIVLSLYSWYPIFIKFHRANKFNSFKNFELFIGGNELFWVL